MFFCCCVVRHPDLSAPKTFEIHLKMMSHSCGWVCVCAHFLAHSLRTNSRSISRRVPLHRTSLCIGENAENVPSHFNAICRVLFLLFCRARRLGFGFLYMCVCVYECVCVCCIVHPLRSRLNMRFGGGPFSTQVQCHRSLPQIVYGRSCSLLCYSSYSIL